MNEGEVSETRGDLTALEDYEEVGAETSEGEEEEEEDFGWRLLYCKTSLFFE